MGVMGGIGAGLSAIGGAASAKSQKKAAEKMSKQEAAYQKPFFDVAKGMSSGFLGALQGGTLSPVTGAYTPYDAMAKSGIAQMLQMGQDPNRAINLANQYLSGTQAASLFDLQRAKDQTSAMLGAYGNRSSGAQAEAAARADAEWALKRDASAFNYALPLFGAQLGATGQGAQLAGQIGQQDKWNPANNMLAFATAQGAKPTDYGQGISPFGTMMSGLGSMLAMGGVMKKMFPS